MGTAAAVPRVRRWSRNMLAQGRLISAVSPSQRADHRGASRSTPRTVSDDVIFRPCDQPP